MEQYRLRPPPRGPAFPLPGRLIAVKGTVGSGKSSLLTCMDNIFKNSLIVETVKEPVDVWEDPVYPGGPTLERRYSNKSEKTNNCALQLKIIRTIVENEQSINEALSQGKTVFMERTMGDSGLFPH